MAASVLFTLIDRHAPLLDAWKAALEKHLPGAPAGRFSLLQADIRDAGTFDCVVSPANSYGIMDGGIDLYIVRAISPSNIDLPIRAVQAHLYKHYRGYLSPGQCTLAPLPDSLRGPTNKLGCRYVAVLPTMRVPERVEWNVDIVYECMWNLLLALEKHNTEAVESGSGDEIKTVVMSGLGTGTGGISPQKCAEQMILAVKHFDEAEAQPDKWCPLRWNYVQVLDDEIGPTRRL